MTDDHTLFKEHDDVIETRHAQNLKYAGENNRFLVICGENND